MSTRYWSDLFAEVQDDVTYKPGYRLALLEDESGRFYYQVVNTQSVCAITGRRQTDKGGKAYLSPHATRSELVQTAFGLFKSYEEHETREFFRWRGHQVFGPHMDITALASIASVTDARTNQEVPA